MRTETKITLTEKEFEAVKTLSGIDCTGVNCSKCPLGLKLDAHGFVEFCFRDRAQAIVNSIENNERMTIR